jgi:hypothetical protein
MSMIFPGMDPYLEDARVWSTFHHRFVVYLADYLQPRLRPRYSASIDDRVYVEGPERFVQPDVTVRWKLRPSRETSATASLAVLDAPIVVEAEPLEIHEPYISIRDRRANKHIITVIEVLSPTNKYSGTGRDQYLTKQAETLSSDAHLVEIDLLRTGPHVLAVPEYLARNFGPYHYLMCINRAQRLRGRYELYPRRLPERLPRIRIPLADDDPDVDLDVQAVVERTYEAGDYRDDTDYDAPCVPPLPPEDQEWANGVIRAALAPPPT